MRINWLLKVSRLFGLKNAVIYVSHGGKITLSTANFGPEYNKNELPKLFVWLLKAAHPLTTVTARNPMTIEEITDETPLIRKLHIITRPR